jgi:hypothetical protein
MRIRDLIVAALVISPNLVEAQRATKWTFGPVMPHVKDAALRTVYGLGVGAAFMGLGIGMDKLNQQQCAGGLGCFEGNPVQTGISFALLGVLFGGTGPTLHSKCTRSGRAMLGIVGGLIGTGVAGVIVDRKMFAARRGEPATFRVMGGGLLGMSAGAGIVTAIC